MRKWSLCLIIILLWLGGQVAADTSLQNAPPTITYFISERTSITVAEAEAGQETTRLTWTTFGMSDDYTLQLYAYEINSWALLNDPNAPDYEPFDPNDSVVIPVRHPVNFNPPTYRLTIVNETGQIISESTVMIPYDVPEDVQPELVRFSTTQTSISADELAYGEPVIPVSWAFANRTPTSNILFEQVMPDGTAEGVDFPRGNLWVSSAGEGAVTAEIPVTGNEVVLRVRLVDLPTGQTLAEGSTTITITGTVSTPTPRPTTAVVPTNTPGPTTGNPPQGSPNNPAPVVSAGSGGGFELGGHVVGFGYANEMRSAGMTWAKKQIRWSRGEGVDAAAGAINEARGNGFKILLAIVGYKDQMGDYDAYTTEFANYLGQVAALAPDAIEVWNEPNIDREWPNGAVNGATYTQMLAKAYNAIKSVNANVMVISGAPSPTGFFGGCAAAGCDDAVFLRQMANAGAVNYMDCVGAHYNEGIISPDQRSGDPRGGHYTRYFSGMLDTYSGAFGGARRVCWTELGYLTGEGYPPLPSFFAWAGTTTLAQHAEWLGRAAALSRSSGRVRLMIVWNVDFRTYTDDPQAGYAIIRADNSCPACATLGAAMQ